MLEDVTGYAADHARVTMAMFSETHRHHDVVCARDEVFELRISLHLFERDEFGSLHSRFCHRLHYPATTRKMSTHRSTPPAASVLPSGEKRTDLTAPCRL